MYHNYKNSSFTCPYWVFALFTLNLDIIMQSLYLSTTLAAAVACLLTSLLLFARRKSGERSRAILAYIIMFSVVNYITRFFDLCQGVQPSLVISVPILLVAIFMVISYIMYPIEVISPGYLNFKRVLILYSPWLLLVGIYLITVETGVCYPPYRSLLHMLPDTGSFHVWFRLLLAILIFAPVMFIYLIPYTRRYNNTDKRWMYKYTFVLMINTIAYMILLIHDSMVYKIGYYYISAGCSIYIAYMELFERLIEVPKEPLVKNHEESIQEINNFEELFVRKNQLCDRITQYMTGTNAYRDPDISLNKLAASLCTNRTTLSKALHDLGYTNFNTYINTLRIEDFIRRIRSKESDNYQDAFYNAGFRSRSTALRNFKQYTGKTPSEYFE